MRDYSIRAATAADLDDARAVMLDTVYRDFGTGCVPDRHADIIDPEAFYLTPPRHTLLVAVDERDGTVAATAALDARGPAHPPNPRWLADRYPSGETAQLRRVYVRPEHRRRGLARRPVAGLPGERQPVVQRVGPSGPGCQALASSTFAASYRTGSMPLRPARKRTMT
ncbi:GNAT family N-acetyltransferase [Streptomyces sp. NPDC001480]|uniref:GNAT family N-acetyltransferase n=1 Tax=Streptomyces sp. NPDC001480 TaxID=3364577 RepID=UPI003677AF5B